MTEAELVALVRAAPEDDAPRLVYADWLLERGDPRGELIRLQCGPDAGLHENEVAELLRQHPQVFFSPLYFGARYVRGFLVELHIGDLEQLATRWGQVRALAPWPPTIRCEDSVTTPGPGDLVLEHLDYVDPLGKFKNHRGAARVWNLSTGELLKEVEGELFVRWIRSVRWGDEPRTFVIAWDTGAEEVVRF